MTISNNKTMKLVIYIILALWAVAVIYTTATKEKQWDFKTYYYAAQTHLAGENPYDSTSVSEVAGTNVHLEYVYPPLTIYTFYPFLLVPFPIASLLYLSLKLFALAALLYLWWSRFLDNKKFAVILFLLAAIAFRETITRDLYAGNISIFEQLCLWLAIYNFINKKIVWFCLLILLTAQFKFMFIVFLLLPLFDKNRNSSLMAIGTGLMLGAQFAISYLFVPNLMENWIANIASLPHGGHANQTIFAVIQEVLTWLTELTGGELSRLDLLFHLGFLLLLLLYTYQQVSKYNFTQNRIALVVLTLFLYTLMMPRMKDYSYIIMIIPALFVITQALNSIWTRTIVLVVICVSFLPYQTPLAVLFLYLLYLRHLNFQTRLTVGTSTT